MMDIRQIGTSPFNYRSYSEFRFIQYLQQISHVMALQPRTVLEIGPGDHTVTDFLRRKGYQVTTVDSDPALSPDLLVDIRKEFDLCRRFDVILASKVLEHIPARMVGEVLDRMVRHLNSGGSAVIAVPYASIRFCRRGCTWFGGDAGGTRIPYPHLPKYWVHLPAGAVRGLWRMLLRRRIAGSFDFTFRVPPDENSTDVHHWDLGRWPTTRRWFRGLLEDRFAQISEFVYVNTNCVFYVARTGSATTSS